jgi:[protein-PII] uridylyltransferase
VQQFARHVGDQNRLDYLFALTVADINGTNPKLWNAWRGSLLRSCTRSQARPAARPGKPRGQPGVDRGDARALRASYLEYRGFTTDELDELWRERGEDYFLRERPRTSPGTRRPSPTISTPTSRWCWCATAVESSVANTTQIFIYAPFDIGAFSRTCSCSSSST